MLLIIVVNNKIKIGLPIKILSLALIQLFILSFNKYLQNADAILTKTDSVSVKLK